MRNKIIINIVKIVAEQIEIVQVKIIMCSYLYTHKLP